MVVEVEKDKTTSGYELKLPDGLVVWKVKLKPAEERNRARVPRRRARQL